MEIGEHYRLPSRHIIPVWKEIFEATAQQQGIIIDKVHMESLLRANAESGTGFVCRKCFSAFNKYLEHRVGLVENMKNVISHGPFQFNYVADNSHDHQSTGSHNDNDSASSDCHAGKKRSGDQSEIANLYSAKRTRVASESQLNSVRRRLNFAPTMQGSPAVAVR